MSFKKAVSLGFIQTAVSMAASFLSVKVTSVYLGPAGIGLLSQLQYFMAMSLGVVASGVNTGVVRLTAEYGTNDARRRTLVSTVMRGLLVVGLPVSAVIILLAPTIASQLLDNAAYAPVLMLFGALYLCGLFGSLLGGLANGAKDYKSTTLINIASVVTGLGLFALLCPIYGVWGGLVAAALGPLATLTMALIVSRGRPWLERQPWAAGFSREELQRIAGFIPMAATSAVVAPLVQILVRDVLGAHSGMTAVGLLQGVWRLSDLYLGIITSTLTMYFLPRFAEIRTALELSREIRRGLLLIVPIVALISGLIYLLRDILILVIFTRDFLPMRDLFAWQMIGNVLKMAGWFLGYVLVAKGSPIVFAVLEVASGGVWIALAYKLIPGGGAVGAVQAYVAIYGLYLLATAGISLGIVRRMDLKDAR